MKKLSISLLLIGMTNFGFAQYELPVFGHSFNHNPSDVNWNADYLREVQKDSTPLCIKQLQREVLNWNLNNSSEFGLEKGELLKTTFKTPVGHITVNYDYNGNIVSAVERFQNVPLPYPITRDISRQHLGWNFIQTKYVLTYKKGRTTKKFFKVVIEKDNQKKRLKIHV